MLFIIQLRKLLLLFTAVTLLITVLVFFNRPYDVKAATKKEFTGEEIYKGVVFGQGPVTKIIPQVWDEEKIEMANSKESKKIINTIISEMKAKDSTYFKRFEQSFKTKDLSVIKQEFENGSTLLKDTIESQDLIAQTNENTPLNNTGNIVVLSGPVSLSNIQALYLINPVILNNVYNVSVLSGLGSNSEFEKEKLIQDISNSIVD
ncbi:MULTISPECIES: sporulation delaying protein family toxin [Bacillus]|uniref:sporulation delaying protein family toxin n=1 Tax=Bacillus TaxID=1386 RepID=UPI001063FA04|nr:MULTISPECIES: sporulation delaying protein family toxin [Bacillus]NYS75832.1 sporulation delaying protein family toxin [Bacillus sp. BH32]TKH54508.1 sporulation delaying protein family toxin [Bacillus cereus]HDX9529914.1 sporulation delaying protein family toxin [Bacillus thuringiensis]